MKLMLQQLPNVKGEVRQPLLAPEAALALVAVEKDTDGLVYTDMWREPVASLLARRTRRGSQLPGYSSHNYGLAVDLNVKSILIQKKIRYEDLLWIMKKRGWFCHRRDGQGDMPESDHFTFLGEKSEKYLAKCSQDPTTWQTPAEIRIWELYSNDFQLTTEEVSVRLVKMGFLSEPTKKRDIYMREAILAFQRAWDLTETGSPDMTLCRVLSFVTAEREVLPLPSWISA